MRAKAMELLGWWAALSLVWLGTLSTANPVEIGAGVAGGLLGALAAVVARTALGASWRPSKRWPRWTARLPAAVLTDSARVLFGRSRVTARDAPVTGDHAVAGALLNATPSTVVVADRDDVLVLHALGDKVSGLERELSR